MEFLERVSLAPFTSWQVGGPADWFCRPESAEDVERALEFAIGKNLPWAVLGGGSNVLVSDDGVAGLVIATGKLSRVESREEDGRLVIDAQAGAGKNELLKLFLKHKLPPALFLAGLPGDVGGGIVMNAGVAESFVPREFHEIVDSFEIVAPAAASGAGAAAGKTARRTFAKDEVSWSYRHSRGWQPGVIVSARISWPLAPDEAILQKVRDANRVRLSKQPLELPSCGSVFVNPPGHKAAQLVDGCGLKGYAVGGAMVSPKHANFIVNTGGAKASDLKAVIAHVQATVKQRTGVDLVTEVVMLGR